MKTRDDDIAVIGMSGRFPGANSVAELWNNLCAGKHSIRALSDDELRGAGVPERDIADPSYVKAAASLDDVQMFDPAFFKISPIEAELMDPQIRLLLQCAWETLEDAGHATKEPQNIGVFAGAGGVTSSYFANHVNRHERFDKLTAGPTHLGNDKDFLSTSISYRLNLTGPSITVQTACSTSLVALHQARMSLLNGECEMALAGGVTVRVPHGHGYHYREDYIFSKSGRIRSFDEGADGVVFGSGLGLVLLKRLSDAVLDGDPIHAVLKGSAIVNDGKGKMSYAASSAKGQIACVRAALKNAGVEAATIGFVESHGTGTHMGDPEEVKALAAAFREQTDRKSFCALGAVKANLGHLEAAAGIVGFIKAVLAVQRGVVPPATHFEAPNSRIKFDNTPFYVNRELAPWQPEGQQPRRAAVNSLGIGGTNAFAIVEQYVPPKAVPREARGPFVVPLSARTEESLRAYAQRLLDFVAAEHRPPLALADLAYTLQVGRDPMERRVAFAVATLDELALGLQRFLEGAAPAPAKGKAAPLVAAWNAGQPADWSVLHSADTPQRITLPTYAFAKRRCWIDNAQPAPSDGDLGAVSNRKQTGNHLHPLLHRNVSDFHRQAYCARFEGNEFFLSDHRVKDARVLPGVAYLEMVRVALSHALPTFDSRHVEFREHTWIQPVIASAAVEIKVALFDNSDEGAAERWIDYEIFSECGAQSTLHCRGSVRCSAALPTPDAIDLNALNNAMSGKRFAGAALYECFAALGLRYGPSMQSIVDLRTGDEEVLAQLQLPASTDPKEQSYGLHPSMMDGAMQCAICLLGDFGSVNARAVMPFSVDAIHVYAGTSRDMLAWVRLANGSSAASNIERFDIDLMDRSGIPCVQIRGLVVRTVATVAASATVASIDRQTPPTRPQEPALRALLPIWNPVRFGRDTVTPDPGERCLLLGSNEPVYRWLQHARGKLQHWQVSPDTSIAGIGDKLATLSFDHLLWFAPELGDADRERGVDAAPFVASQNAGVLSLFRIIKALTQLDYLDRELSLTVVTCRTQQVFGTDNVLPHHAGIHGMIGSIAKELPQWRIRLLDIESIADVTAQEILALPWDEQGHGLAYRHGEWFRQEFAEVSRIPAANSAYRRNGVYIVIGGAGGIGEVWTRHMVQQFGANVIWIGRRPLDGSLEAKLDAIAVFGKRPLYFAADASDASALAAVVQQIVKKFPTINGVVHSALVLQDQGVRGIDETVFRQGLAAKVDVSVSLETVFRDHDLDFMLFFSSAMSFTRSAGQSNYSAGCTFKDSFAHSLRATRRYPVKIVNWGYWGSVGVVTDEFYRKRMERLGFGSIEPDEAMQALERFVASEIDQLVLIKLLSDAALGELLVSEEIRYYADLEAH